MKDFLVLHEKRRNISERSCPVDLMSEIAEEEPKGTVAFKLTAKALIAMLTFPRKTQMEVEQIDAEKSWRQVQVTWPDFQDTMQLWTEDGGKTFFVEDANTEEILCHIENHAAYTLYVIDVE